MAYIVIPDTDIDQDSPVKVDLMTNLRDNPIEMMAGAAGAPRLQLAALEEPAAGTVVRWRDDVEATHNNVGAWTELASWFFIQTGTIRIAFEHRVSVNTGFHDSEYRILRNGTILQNFSNFTTGYVAESLDVAIVPGDIVSIERFYEHTTYLAYRRNFRIQTNGENLWPHYSASNWEFA